MNRTIFWRVFWKEYRLQRALWLAMALLTVLLLVLFSPDAKERGQWLFQIAVAFPALYAMGCGALLFAGEREADTYEFQRTLPVHARCVFFAKITLALLSMATLFGLMWSLAAFLNSWKLPDPHDHYVLWASWGFFGVETYFWTTLFSLRTTRVMVAAILGMVGASLAAYVAAMNFKSPGMLNVADAYTAALSWRVIITTLVAVLDFWIAAHWFEERHGRRVDATPSGNGLAIPTNTTAFSHQFRMASRGAILGRLAWQHWRQSKWIMATFAVLFIPLAFVVASEMALVLASSPQGQQLHNTWKSTAIPFAIMFALVGVPLVGLCTFLGDQWKRSFRFLANRGVSPSYIWLSRQTVVLAFPAILVVVIILAACLLAALLLPHFSPMDRSHLERLSEIYTATFAIGYVLLGVVVYTILGLAVGQLCGMLLRSSILAGIASVSLTGILTGWCWLMWFWDNPLPKGEGM